MWSDLVSNPGPLTYESGALPTALRDPAPISQNTLFNQRINFEHISHFYILFAMQRILSPITDTSKYFFLVLEDLL